MIDINFYRWGCAHEKDALAAYKDILVNKNDNFMIIKVSLFVDSTHPILGATPDDMTQCTCSSNGTVEVKSLLLQG